MKKSFYLAVLLLLAACSKEDLPVITPPTINHNLSTTIPLSEALCSLDEMIQGLSMVTKSSQAPTYSTASIITIGQSTFPKTKTDRIGLGFPDTLMYLVNFDNDKGFAVLAGDTRLGENVYCLQKKEVSVRMILLRHLSIYQMIGLIQKLQKTKNLFTTWGKYLCLH